MKIIDIKVEKEVIDGLTWLVCTVSPENGEQFTAHAPWVNKNGLWASKDKARDPAEVAAWLRNFADAIDRYVQEKAA